jgi:hypothetical protein
MATTITTSAVEPRLRRWLLIAATFPTVFGILHHLEHVLRDSVGWPLSPDINPFTFSLLIYVFVLPGLYLTYRGRLWAGYWLVIALASVALVVPVHVGPVADDSLEHIHSVYVQPLAFFVALAILVSLFVSLVLLALTAIRVRVLSGHW